MLKLYLIIATILLFYLFYEYLTLSFSVKKIPLRILVNGTRGKSTTVKLIYNILRDTGINVYAKITGNKPIILSPDGSSRILKRYSPPSIIENIKLLRQFARGKPDAVILECMALQSETQLILGKYIFKPNHTILTNILPDHKEVMGTNLYDHIQTLLGCITNNSHIYILEDTNTILKNLNISFKSIRVVKNISFKQKFTNIPNNVITRSWSLLSEFTNSLNLDQQLNLKNFKSIWESINQNIKYVIPNSNFEIWNLFSVNDVITTKEYINHSLRISEQGKNKIFLLNNRKDRPLRTQDFALYIADNFRYSEVWLTGDGKQLARSILIKNNFNKENILMLNQEDLINKINSLLKEKIILYCIGNYKNMEQFLLNLQYISKELQNLN